MLWRFRRLVKNPLIVKDGLSRVRTWRAPAVVALYLAVLGLVVYLTLTVQLSSLRPSWGFAQVGRNVFVTIAEVQLALVCLFAPAVAAGAISGERERQTLDVLLVSSMTPWAIVWGKLVTSVAFLLLLLTAALPVFATVFFLAGIDFQQFVVSQLVTVATAFGVGSVSLLSSVVFRRTLVSTVVAYGFTFAATAGTWLVGTVLTQIAYMRSQVLTNLTGLPPPPDPHPLLLMSPFNGMTSVLQNANGGRVSVGQTIHVLLLAPGKAAAAGPAVEPWQATVLFQLVLVALSVFGAIQLLRSRRVSALLRSG